MIMLTDKRRLKDKKIKAPHYRNCRFFKSKIISIATMAPLMPPSGLQNGLQNGLLMAPLKNDNIR